VRTALAMALLLVVASVGCQQETTGPTTSDYEAAREQALAKARQGGSGSKSDRENARAGRSEAEEAEEEADGVRVAAYEYDPTGKRDPFRSFLIENAKNEAEDDAGPLERFDLNQLSVIATVWKTDDPRALVADPSGRSYVVGQGARVGKNDGRVVQITDGRVVVKETYVDWLGERTTKNVEMRLHREGKGG